MLLDAKPLWSAQMIFVGVRLEGVTRQAFSWKGYV